MGAPTSSGRFRLAIYSMSRADDASEYEGIAQSHRDGDGRYEILEESSHWTKEGELMIALKYLELEDAGDPPERY